MEGGRPTPFDKDESSRMKKKKEGIRKIPRRRVGRAAACLERERRDPRGDTVFNGEVGVQLGLNWSSMGRMQGVV